VKGYFFKREKCIKVDFPRYKSFKVEMCYLPREVITGIRERNTVISFNRVSRQKEETVDTDKFMDEYIKSVIVGWSGLTLEIVKNLVPIAVKEEDLKTPVPYSHDDAMWLVKNSTEFDSFVSDTLNQVDLFSVTTKEENLKK
jgi:hypothetical protein